MSRVLSSIVGKPQEQVAKIMAELEAKYGYPSHDVRMLAENINTVRQKHEQLGLDPDDTTPEELYHAVLARYAHDCQELNQSLGIDDEASLEQRFTAAKRLVRSACAGQEVWALKRSRARDLLRIHPAKKVMKKLGYRSLESMLKREDISSVFILAKIIETEAWNSQTTKLIAKQATNNFERRQPHVTHLAGLQSLLGPGDNGLVLYDQAMGAVGIVASDSMPALTMSLLILHGLEVLGIKLSLAKLGSTLSFWENTQSLFAWKEPEAISFNLYDAAKNSINQASFNNRNQSRGAESFWSELMGKYGHDLQSIEQNLTTEFKQIINLPEPAIEYDLAENVQ